MDALPQSEQIIASFKPSLLLELTPESQLTLWQSKVGGLPYLPKQREYPCNLNTGKRLQLLAQINFAELPANSIYPQQGILQFYIDSDDDLWGLNFDDQREQIGFRILFFPEVFNASEKLQALNPDEFIDADGPVTGQYAVNFKPQMQPISPQDLHFDAYCLGQELDEEQLEDALEQYEQAYSAQGHRLGGYPYFTQADPRDGMGDELAQYILLLQIDSDEQILWGDVGVCNFFIHPDDLKKCDFSAVLYNWDCH